jgi:hypothetical protein
MKLKAPAQWNECKGIFVDGCVERGEGSSFRAKAHCHNDNHPQYPYFGWICVRSIKRIGGYVMASGLDGFDGEVTKPSQLLIHEYAHLLAPNQGHTVTFFRKLKELGGHITKSDKYWCPKTLRKFKRSKRQ